MICDVLTKMYHGNQKQKNNSANQGDKTTLLNKKMTHNKQPLHQHYPRSPSSHRTAGTWRCTCGCRPVRPWGTGTCCRGRRWRCSWSRRSRRRSPCSRRSGTRRGCTGRCCSGTGRCGMLGNLQVNDTVLNPLHITLFFLMYSNTYLRGKHLAIILPGGK